MHSQYKHLYALALFLLSIIGLGYLPDQEEFFLFLPLWSIAFLTYGYLYKEGNKVPLPLLVGGAVLARVCLVGAFPNLSDDIFRFIWDGRSMHAGLNPLSALPIDIVGSAAGLNQGLLDFLNSPVYYSIYPPVAQGVYWFSTLWPSDNYMTEVIVMKMILLTAELATLRVLWLLIRSSSHRYQQFVVYAFNPLIILEIMGNVHFEGVMILFLLISIYLLRSNRSISAAIMLAAAIGAKLLPILFVPAIFLFLPTQKRWGFLLTLSLATGLLFLPMISNLPSIHNLVESVSLYINKFEFNAGLYYLLRWWGNIIYGYNMIHLAGPILLLGAGCFILYLAYRVKDKATLSHLITTLFWSYIAYAFATATLHPWYLAIPIALSALTQYRFVMVWSFLIGWTYINYTTTPYQEQLWVVALEYGIVSCFLIWEFNLANLRRYIDPLIPGAIDKGVKSR